MEDHGYIIDFGVEGKTGFLLRKNAVELVRSQYKGRSLCVGQVVRCVVLSGADTRTVPISINPSDVSTAMMSASDHLVGIGSLLPGVLVKAAVKEVSSCVRNQSSTMQGERYAYTMLHCVMLCHMR